MLYYYPILELRKQRQPDSGACSLETYIHIPPNTEMSGCFVSFKLQTHSFRFCLLSQSPHLHLRKSVSKKERDYSRDCSRQTCRKWILGLHLDFLVCRSVAYHWILVQINRILKRWYILTSHSYHHNHCTFSAYKFSYEY